jgi:hypothetical protein
MVGRGSMRGGYWGTRGDSFSPLLGQCTVDRMLECKITTLRLKMSPQVPFIPPVAGASKAASRAAQLKFRLINCNLRRGMAGPSTAVVHHLPEVGPEVLGRPGVLHAVFYHDDCRIHDVHKAAHFRCLTAPIEGLHEQEDE